MTWGVGPAFGIPTTTDPLLGNGKWTIGPTAVVLKLSGPWTCGFLVNQLWSFADTSDVERETTSARPSSSPSWSTPGAPSAWA